MERVVFHRANAPAVTTARSMDLESPTPITAKNGIIYSMTTKGTVRIVENVFAKKSQSG